MTPGELAKAVSTGKIKPAYYFFGSEDYRMVEAEKYIASKFLSPEALATNYRRINGRKTKAADLIAELSVFPMLGERQMFSITDFQSYKPTEIKKVLASINPPDPNRVILFMTPSARAPKKSSAFVKNMGEIAVVVEFGKLGDSEARGNIVSRLKKEGLEIEPEALARLIQMLAGNRGALVSETDKLINYLAGQERLSKTVSLEDISQVTTGHEVYSVFDLAELVVARKLVEALTLVDRLLGEGGSATGLLYFVTQHFLTLYNLKNGKPLEPYRKFLTRAFQAQADKFSMAELESAIKLLAETDAELRRQRFTGRMAFESLLVNLIHKPEKTDSSGKILPGVG